MSGAIEPGMVVVCIDDSPCKCCGTAITVRRGSIYRVEAVAVCNSPHGSFDILILHGIPARPNHLRGTNAARFRRIDDEVTEAFREQIRAKPVRPSLNPSRHSREMV